ncbi:plexin domain-containing protein 2 [Ctenocephalides felis]|uniref:plexin domain-containing protein 2 n=1 Tax=Ctenocephalides felis TaxID=7515 RepID=UPI000E6E3D67|nr:plexin domain-containing protein 2 [Ctenocephalides felis]
MFQKCSSSISKSVLLILAVGLCTSLAIQDRERLHYTSSNDRSQKILTDFHLLQPFVEHHHHLAKRSPFQPQVNNGNPSAADNGTAIASSKDEGAQQVPAVINVVTTTTAPLKNNGEGDSSKTEGENRSDSSNSSAGGDSAPAATPTRDNHQPPSRPQQQPSGSTEQLHEPAPATTPSPQIVQQNILGANGTGIRWTNVSVSSTGVTKEGGRQLQHPLPVVSEPILPDEINNSTLTEHNITQNKTDSHDYYNSTISTDPEVGKMYWDQFASPERLNSAQVSDLLSSSHRRAVTVQLKFAFPFYGHSVRNVTVATGGFLYTGDYVHSWLAATQYIAPLMANFDTSLSNNSYVKFYDNGTAFTVLWENVCLQDRPEVGPFTFSATLMDTGDIVFVYKTIPVLVEKIEDNKHPVKVGLSDAYIIDRTIFFTRRKTIYEYHRVQFKQEDIKNGTTIYLKLLPTCVAFTDCQSCLTNHTGFVCSWCEATNRCSSGLDRYRQEWLSKGCNINNVSKNDQCPALEISAEVPRVSKEKIPSEEPESVSPSEQQPPPKASGHRSPSGVVVSDNGELENNKDAGTSAGHGALAALIPLCLIVAIAGWLLYAYRNPHTKSGQMLIRYRPSQWTWRRGEARYTAATIHM